MISAWSVPGFMMANRALKNPLAPSARIHVFWMVGSVPFRNSAVLVTPSPSASAAMSVMPNRAIHAACVSPVGEVASTVQGTSTDGGLTSPSAFTALTAK